MTEPGRFAAVPSLLTPACVGWPCEATADVGAAAAVAPTRARGVTCMAVSSQSAWEIRERRCPLFTCFWPFGTQEAPRLVPWYSLVTRQVQGTCQVAGSRRSDDTGAAVAAGSVPGSCCVRGSALAPEDVTSAPGGFPTESQLPNTGGCPAPLRTRALAGTLGGRVPGLRAGRRPSRAAESVSPPVPARSTPCAACRGENG